MSLEIVKKRGKELDCTINDIIMTATSRTIKQHFESLGDTTTRSIYLALPVSLRPPPSTVDDIQLLNQFAILPMKLRLIDDCMEGLKLIKGDMRAMKTSMEPLGWLYSVKLIG